MIRTIAIAAAVAGTALTASVAAHAGDFPATPMNMGAPTNLPGETIIPGMRESMMMVNHMTQPILQPMLAPAAMTTSEPMAKPMMHHHHHHMMMKKKMMMHKKMTMQKSM